MMRLILLAGLCMLMPGCAPPLPPPICAQKEVLLLVAERLQRAGRGQVIEADSVGQIPGDDPDLVRCAVRVRTVDYNTNLFGPAPVVVVGIIQYAIRLQPNGLFLLPAAGGIARPEPL